MAKHFDKQFKLDAVQYYHDHRELGLVGCASNLGISQQSLSRWQKELHSHCDYMSPGDFERLYQQATSELLGGILT